MTDWPFGELQPGSFDVILADPPWRHRSNSVAKPGRNPMRHYQTMTLAELAGFPLGQLGAPVSMLACWITSAFLVAGLHLPLFKAWGYKPTALGWTWIKLNPSAPGLFIMKQDLHIGTGHTTRKNAEFLLIGKRGRSLRQDRMNHEIIIAPRREHSRKPVEAMERIEKYVGPGLRMVELFSRSGRAGWSAWGDEVGKFDD